MRHAALAWLASLGLVALSACALSPGPAPEEQRQWVGELSRKGPKGDRWWALRDAQGRLWRLAPRELAPWQASLAAWQFRTVVATGRLTADPEGSEIALEDLRLKP